MGNCFGCFPFSPGYYSDSDQECPYDGGQRQYNARYGTTSSSYNYNGSAYQPQQTSIACPYNSYYRPPSINPAYVDNSRTTYRS